MDEQEVMETLRKRMEKRMRKKGLTAKDLSINAGVANTYVSDILARRSEAPGLLAVAKIADALKTTVGYLIGETDDH